MLQAQSISNSPKKMVSFARFQGAKMTIAIALTIDEILDSLKTPEDVLNEQTQKIPSLDSLIKREIVIEPKIITPSSEEVI
jgi:hypothetical protein